MSRPFRLSVAVPLYNEESVLLELLRRTGTVLESLAGGPHEIVASPTGARTAIRLGPSAQVLAATVCHRAAADAER